MSQTEALAGRLMRLIRANDEFAPMALETLGALRGRERHAALHEVITGVEDYDIALRQSALAIVGSNEPGQKHLLDMAEESELPPDLMFALTQMTHRSRWQDVRVRAKELLPWPANKDGAELPPMGDLVKMEGDAVRGRDVFRAEATAQCSRCHIVNGEGKDVGPDLSNIGEKLSVQALYESILSPSAGISHQYVTHVIDLGLDGEYTGFIRNETADVIELVDAAGEEHRINKADIESRSTSPISIMPEGLAGALTTQELADLVAYLATLK